MPVSERNILMLLLLVSLYLIEPRLFAANYKRRKPLISTAGLSLNNATQFISLTGFPFDFLKRRYFDVIRPILRFTRESIKEWLQGGALRLSANGRPFRLSGNDRGLMAFMVLKDYNVKMLEITWGMCKSMIYMDSYLILSIFLKLRGDELTLPLVGSMAYNALVGVGAFADKFDRAVWMMDGHNVTVQKPPHQQREYYNGRSKEHTVNFLTVHSGFGKCYFCHGGEPGRINDIELLRRSEFGANIGLYVAMNLGHWVMCDGIWRYEGLPYITRFCERTALQLTAAQRIFNYNHSSTRVLNENFYGREHALFPILNGFAYRLDKLGVIFRCCVILTNDSLELSPLR